MISRSEPRPRVNDAEIADRIGLGFVLKDGTVASLYFDLRDERERSAALEAALRRIWGGHPMHAHVGDGALSAEEMAGIAINALHGDPKSAESGEDAAYEHFSDTVDEGE